MRRNDERPLFFKVHCDCEFSCKVDFSNIIFSFESKFKDFQSLFESVSFYFAFYSQSIAPSNNVTSLKAKRAPVPTDGLNSREIELEKDLFDSIWR